MRHRRSPRRFAPHHFPLLLPAIVLLALSTGVDVAWGARDTEVVIDEDDAADESPALPWRKRIEQGLKAMSVGSLEDRLDAVDDAGDLLEPDDIDEQDGPASPTQQEIGAMLVGFLQSEPDEWIRWNLLDSLETESGPAVQALFRAALVSPSSNLRAKALSFYAFDSEDPTAVPLLEGLWETGVPPWALPDLMAALAAQGSTTHLGEFLERTGAPDVRTRLGAVEALSDLLDDRALPRLLELARSGESFTRRAAIDALQYWSDSDEAVETLAEAAMSDPEWRGHALDSLLKSENAIRDETVFRVLSNPDDRALWARAAGGLVHSGNPEANAALVGALAAAAARNDPATVRSLIMALSNRDDSDAVPLLSQLDPGMDGSGIFTVRSLIRYLERDRESQGARRFVSTAPPSREPEADQRHVLAGGEARSVRCWQGPQVAFESWLEHRIPDGAEVTIETFFDQAGETWAALEGSGAGGCWVPLRQIEDGPGPGVVPPDPRRREIDLPAGALRTSTARALLKEGTIEVFDESDEAVAIAVNIRVPGPSLQEILETLKSATRRSLEEQMDDVLAWLGQERRAGMPRPDR